MPATNLGEHRPRPEEVTQIHGTVDRLLQEQSRYVPVELLIRLGRLPYPRYEAWRCGEAPTLEACLAGNPRRIRALLEVAAEWVRRLGLTPEPHTYTGWGTRTGHALCCTAQDAAGESLYTTHYRRPDNAGDGQFDLFYDSGATAALNGLRHALQARRPEAAADQLALLLQRNPDHPLVPAAQLLCDALAHLHAGIIPHDPAAELEAIERHVAPAAREVLGAQARDLLAPFWRRLGQTLAGRAYDPAAERLHGSWIHAQCLDWQAVRASVLATADWAAQPLLVTRLAAACRQAGEREEAIGHWCRLCWRFPEQAAAALSDRQLPDLALRASWERFEDQAEPAWDAAWFPAWLLLAEPGLSHRLALDAAADEPGPGRAYRLLHQLLGSDCRDAASHEIALRQALQATSPALLRIYLNRRDAVAGRGATRIPHATT